MSRGRHKHGIRVAFKHREGWLLHAVDVISDKSAKSHVTGCELVSCRGSCAAQHWRIRSRRMHLAGESVLGRNSSRRGWTVVDPICVSFRKGEERDNYTLGQAPTEVKTDVERNKLPGTGIWVQWNGWQRRTQRRDAKRNQFLWDRDFWEQRNG
jgi:hypothetical protein